MYRFNLNWENKLGTAIIFTSRKKRFLKPRGIWSAYSMCRSKYRNRNNIQTQALDRHLLRRREYLVHTPYIHSDGCLLHPVMTWPNHSWLPIVNCRAHMHTYICICLKIHTCSIFALLLRLCMYVWYVCMSFTACRCLPSSVRWGFQSKRDSSENLLQPARMYVFVCMYVCMYVYKKEFMYIYTPK